jgi:hypothetical protein
MSIAPGMTGAVPGGFSTNCDVSPPCSAPRAPADLLAEAPARRDSDWGALRRMLRGTFLHRAVVLAAGAGALLVLPAPALALEQKLVAPGATGYGLGDSVAVDGDTAVVGAPFDVGTRGAVYVFTRTGDSWTQTAKLTASDGAAEDGLGDSVAIDGDTIVVGASAKAPARFARVRH